MSRRPRVLGWLMLTAGVLILAATSWVGWRSYQAYDHLQEASAQVALLQTQLSDITAVDPAATEDTVHRLQAASSAAKSAVGDPVYGAAVAIPLIGPNLGAMRSVAGTVDVLATDVMPSLVEVARELDPAQLAPKDGIVDLQPIRRISPLLQQADAAVHAAIDQVSGIDRASIVTPLGDAVDALQDKLASAADVTGPGARLTRLLPPMLGSAAPRTYLVVFQNPTELRATGGMFGSFALVRADNGKITIAEQGATKTLGRFDPPVADLTADQQALYGARIVRFPADVNFTPDFPTAASLFLEMYRLRTGTTVDGVLAIDPVALSYVLEGAAPIDVGNGISISADNVVSVLLSTAYQEFAGPDQSARDAFLAGASAEVFGAVMSGAGVPSALVNGLRQANDERRLLIYSTNATEQADIARTSLAGTLNADPAEPSIGVFFNDGTQAKLGYYLTSEVHVTDAGCANDGGRRLTVRVGMHYDGPTTGLPDYVTGSVPAGEPYVLRTNVLIFAPAAGRVANTALRDGAITSVSIGQDQSREVATATVALTPGDSTELEFTVLAPSNPSGSGAAVTPQLVLTPGVSPWVTSTESYGACSPPAA